MKIAFYAGSCIPIHARSLEERPLGGTETGLIRLAEQLHSRGHDISVFTSMKTPPSSQPRYLPKEQVLKSGMFDLVVLVQDWSPAFLGVPGPRIFYWTGDGWDQYANYGIGDRRVAKRVEKLLAVSQWQADTLCERSGYPRAQTHIIGNGVELSFFEGREERKRKRLIFTAAPYRGLELVPPIYRALKSKHPDLELHIFSGFAIYDREQPFSGPLVERFLKLKTVLNELPDCHLYENVPQRKLARELMKSSVFIYPNIIFETCCITALEALAAGCPVVASATSALPGTVGDAGIVIEGTPGSKEYLERFAQAVDLLLSNDTLWQELSEKARKRIDSTYRWEHVAERFEELL